MIAISAAGKLVDAEYSLRKPITIEVCDRGIGIPADLMQRLFARFERLAPDRRRGGFGLGLWITRQIVSAFGGTIDVRSELGIGSTFVVDLPRRPMAPARLESRGPAPKVKDPAILIVDDDAALRTALAEVLADEGYTVATASDGADGLGYLQDGHRPRVILLDLMMPGVDGWDFRATQKRDPEFADIPVIAVSAAGKLLDAEYSLRKPIKIETLLEILRTVLADGSRVR